MCSLDATATRELQESTTKTNSKLRMKTNKNYNLKLIVLEKWKRVVILTKVDHNFIYKRLGTRLWFVSYTVGILYVMHHVC